jgi:O-antigen/teichoic acid export membrane protein
VLGRLLLLMIPLSAGAVGLAMASPWLVRWWLGDVAVGSMNLYWGFAAYVLLFCWTNTWANFLNGVGEIRVQMYSALVAAAVNVPLSVWLVRGMGLGEAGVIWGTVASLSLFSLIGPIETARVARRHS